MQLGDLDIEVTEDRSQKVRDMLDAFFDREHKDHRNVRSFRECYIEITGDRRVTGQWQDVDKRRLAEALGVPFREALDSTSWASVLGDSITRRLIADYRRPAQYDIWRQICGVVPVNEAPVLPPVTRPRTLPGTTTPPSPVAPVPPETAPSAR